MHNWSIDEGKFKKEDPEGYKIWRKHKEEINRTVDFLAKNQWVVGGEVYVRKRQEKTFFNEFPLFITAIFKKDIPKHEYVTLGFNLDEIAQDISVIQRSKAAKEISSSRLVAKF